MLTFRDGVASSPAGGKAMASYLLAGTLKPDTAKAAAYYLGEEAHEERVRAFWGAQIERGEQSKGHTVAELRPDLSPALAARLGINTKKPLSEAGVANLLNATRLDGSPIEGRKKHSATWSIAEVSGLDARQSPTAEAIRNVLSGRRADGGVPQKTSGKEFSAEIVQGARRRFMTALGVPSHREPTGEEITRLENGLMANGRMIDRADYRRKIHATKPPVGFTDMTFSADKSLSVAWALAPTAHERDLLLDIHRQAVADTMRYVETQLGFVQRGGAANRSVEAAEMGWISFQHYTARPAVDIARKDDQGRSYTEIRDVPLKTADPQLHTHVTAFNSALTAGGHVGALDLRRRNGRVKEFGAVYHAHVAARARQLGIDVALNQQTGAAELTAIPRSVRDLFSKRTVVQAGKAAREFAREKGLDWDTLDGEQKIAFLKAGAAETRQAKEGDKTDFGVWHEQAQAASYRHRSVIIPRQKAAETDSDERIQAAYRTALPMVDSEFKRRAAINEQELREIAARSLITAGIGKRPGEDIDAVMKAFREQGVMQDGQRVELVVGPASIVRGKEQRQVTTALHRDQERELVRLARTAADDMSAALPSDKINRAVDAFLERNPKINPNSAQWKAQHDMMTRLATGGRLSVAIGAAGSGKSTVIAPMVDAWKAEGREVYGAAIAWRQTNDLKSAGIDEGAAVAAFLKRVEAGTYTLDRNTVLVVDEVGQVGTPKMLDLLRLQDKTGMQLVFIGDDKQCRQIEGAGSIELLRDALGEGAIPQILTSVRQKAEREREIAGLFRAGRAAEALEMKQQDGTAILVAGGPEETVKRVAKSWLERTEANRDDPTYKLTVSAPTNADAREIGAAIRTELRAIDQLGKDVAVLDATDRNGEKYKLPLAIGDRVRLFDRVHDARAENRKKVLASNGEVAEIRALTAEGIVLRNSAGTEGLVAWNKIQRPGAPVRLTYGYAVTVDTAQGSTATEHILALPNGSQAIQGFKAYTAASRHQQINLIIIDEASERRQLASRAMLGHKPHIGETDVWQNVSENLSRQPLKPGALAMLQRTRDAPRPRARPGL